MSHRVRERAIEDGDLLAYDDWNEFHRPYVEEFNGRIDRDNIPQDVIETSLIKANAFTAWHEDVQTTTLTTDGNRVDWQRGDGTDDINSLSGDAECEALLVACWNGYFKIADTLGVSILCDMRLMINNIEVARMPQFDLEHMIYRSACMFGALPIPAGPWTAHVEVRYGSLLNSPAELDLEFVQRVLHVEEQRR